MTDKYLLRSNDCRKRPRDDPDIDDAGEAGRGLRSDGNDPFLGETTEEITEPSAKSPRLELLDFDTSDIDLGAFNSDFDINNVVEETLETQWGNIHEDIAEPEPREPNLEGVDILGKACNIAGISNTDVSRSRRESGYESSSSSTSELGVVADDNFVQRIDDDQPEVQVEPQDKSQYSFGQDLIKPKVTFLDNQPSKGRKKTKTWQRKEYAAGKFVTEMKIHEPKNENVNLTFNQPSHVAVFVVHANPDLCSKEINGLNAVPAGGSKGGPEITSSHSCPFEAFSGTNQAIYKKIHDKTFNFINAAFVKVDRVLSIQPKILSRNECRDGVQVGMQEIYRQWKFFIIALSEDEFEEAIESENAYPLAYNQTQRVCFKESVQFVREIRDNRDAKKAPRSGGEISFPREPYVWPEVSTQTDSRADLKKRLSLTNKKFLSMDLEKAHEALDIVEILLKEVFHLKK